MYWQNVKTFENYVGLEKEAIEFKNYFKHMPISFKIYADFERNLKSVESYEGFHSKKKKKKKKIKITFRVVLLTSVFMLLMNLLS